MNAADYTPQVAPGMIVSIFGTDLAPATEAASSVPLPAALQNVSVEVMSTAPVY